MYICFSLSLCCCCVCVYVCVCVSWLSLLSHVTHQMCVLLPLPAGLCDFSPDLTMSDGFCPVTRAVRGESLPLAHKQTAFCLSSQDPSPLLCSAQAQAPAQVRVGPWRIPRVKPQNVWEQVLLGVHGPQKRWWQFFMHCWFLTDHKSNCKDCTKKGDCL